jgi:hypothetical protein
MTVENFQRLVSNALQNHDWRNITMKRVISQTFLTRKKVLLCIGIALLTCASLTGCDREAPVISGIDSVIELDCGTKFNLEDYLNENMDITDETDEGAVQYKLSELEHTIKCNGDVYNADTGEFNTEQFGNYDVEVSVKDKSNNNTTFAFTVKLNPLHMKSSLEEVVEMDCGAIFNVNNYFSENIKIFNLAEDSEYKLDDFDYTIKCDETIYNSASGKLDTGKFGEYDATLIVNSKSFENNTVSFSIKLNPLAIEKGYYVYKNDFASNYEYLGFCEYKNTSVEDLAVTSIEFQFFDKDGVMIASSDMPDYSREYVASGESGYALDTFDSAGSPVSSADEIVNVKVNIEFEKPNESDNTSLEVGDTEIINDYAYNVSGFAGITVVTNPYDKDIEYYALLAGMYDGEGNLIGVMDSMDTDGINANSKARATACWLPDSREIPDMVKGLKASARVTLFDDGE